MNSSLSTHSDPDFRARSNQLPGESFSTRANPPFVTYFSSLALIACLNLPDMFYDLIICVLTPEWIVMTMASNNQSREKLLHILHKFNMLVKVSLI